MAEGSRPYTSEEIRFLKREVCGSHQYCATEALLALSSTEGEFGRGYLGMRYAVPPSRAAFRLALENGIARTLGEARLLPTDKAYTPQDDSRLTRMLNRHPHRLHIHTDLLLRSLVRTRTIHARWGTAYTTNDLNDQLTALLLDCPPGPADHRTNTLWLPDSFRKAAVEKLGELAPRRVRTEIVQIGKAMRPDMADLQAERWTSQHV